MFTAYRCRFLLLMSLLCAGSLPSQSVREARDIRNLAQENDAIAGSQIWFELNGRVSVFDLTQSPAAFHDFATGFAVPGDFTPIAATDILFVGRGLGGGGLIERWVKSGGVFALQDSTAFAGRDFAGVTYDATACILYLLDAEQRAVLRSAWQTTQQLSALNLANWRTEAQLPDLANANSRRLRFFAAGRVESDAMVFLCNADDPPTAQSGVLLTTDAVPTSTDFQWTPTHNPLGDAASMSVAANELAASEQGTTVGVFGNPGDDVEVLDVLSGAVMGSACIPQGSTEVNVTVNSPLTIGMQYIARRVGQPAPSGFEFLAVRRYGYPEILTDGSALKRMYGPRDAHVDNPEFGVRLGISVSPAPQADVEFAGWMAVAVRTNGVDPITSFGGNILLLTDVLVPATGYMISPAPDNSTSDGQGIITGPLPIPAEDSLVGSVILVQFFVQDGSVYRLSEVMGFKLAPAADSMASSRSGPATLGAAFEAWVSELTRQGRAVQDAGLMADIVGRLRNR